MSQELEPRMQCCCFTGHRPEKLTMPENKIKTTLESKIQAAIQDGYRTFISGMSRGVDLWAAEIVLRRRAEDLTVRLICASPYEGFENRWSAEWQALYRRVLSALALGIIILTWIGKRQRTQRGHWKSVFQYSIALCAMVRMNSFSAIKSNC